MNRTGSLLFSLVVSGSLLFSPVLRKKPNYRKLPKNCVTVHLLVQLIPGIIPCFFIKSTIGVPHGYFWYNVSSNSIEPDMCSRKPCVLNNISPLYCCLLSSLFSTFIDANLLPIVPVVYFGFRLTNFYLNYTLT